jgi:hypothetical protein
VDRRPRFVLKPSASIRTIRIKLLALEIAIRISTTHHPEKVVFAPLLGSHGSDNLLRENIERLFPESPNDRALRVAPSR